MRAARALTVLVLGVLALYLLGFPYALGLAALGPLVAVVGILALTLRGAGTLTTWARISAAISTGLGVIATFTGLGMIVLYQPFTELAECQSRALTVTADRECQAEFDAAYQDVLDRFGVELPSQP